QLPGIYKPRFEKRFVFGDRSNLKLHATAPSVVAGEDAARSIRRDRAGHVGHVSATRAAQATGSHSLQFLCLDRGCTVGKQTLATKPCNLEPSRLPKAVSPCRSCCCCHRRTRA